MRLLKVLPDGDVRLTENFPDDVIPQYAILSHTWGEESQEVTFTDMVNGSGRSKAGYEKIKFCGEQAASDGLQHFWVDSCCIDKSSRAELQTAISSMFRWYQRSTKCYVYLSDVSAKKRKRIDETQVIWEHAFRKSRWFARGWTLQELLAPTSVEFFSKESTRLGDSHSLEQQIHEVTGIRKDALRGEPLLEFSVTERMSWVVDRQTTLVEDQAYSLLGIFGVNMPPRYGEGQVSAFERLQKEIDKLQKCVQDIRLTDPHHDKKRIEALKGGLLVGSYRWILEHPNFNLWRNDEQSRLLWIKGDPGKGKTMLLCGIINELNQRTPSQPLLSYFFFQAADSRINNATAALRGLIYMLLRQQPSLVSHIQKKYDYAGKTLFEDSNAWFALSDIFTDILLDPSLNRTYLIIDALDECVLDLQKLVGFIVRNSATSSRVKWIVSSRNLPNIEKDLDIITQKARLCLELNEKSVSAAVTTYIQFKVDKLAKRNGYDFETMNAIQSYLSSNAHGTFLWVSLVCQNIEYISGWNVKNKMKEFPSGLGPLYRHMMEQICQSEYAEYCRKILAVVLAVYRPLTIIELASLVDMSPEITGNFAALKEIVQHCGSFLLLRQRTNTSIISLVHQSAKDFLLEKSTNDVFHSGIADVHHSIFKRSLQIISNTLVRRDIYNLGNPGFSIDKITQPDPDPLAQAKYSCIYWVDHLHDCSSTKNVADNLRDNGPVDRFLRQKYLYWLEALSLLKSMSQGILSMAKLDVLLQGQTSQLADLVRDGCRFIQYHKWGIVNCPLQIYASALIFSPARSIVRNQFQNEEPEWIITKPAVQYNWNACLQTLEGHSSPVSSVAFSPDSKLVASASNDRTVRVWSSETGDLQWTLKGHTAYVTSVAFSPDSKLVASASGDLTVRIWSSETGKLQRTLEGHTEYVLSVAFSPDSQLVASASDDKTVRIWSSKTGDLQRTLEGHIGCITSVTFTPDSTLVASASDDQTVRLWSSDTGDPKRTLEGHTAYITSIAFSPDSKLMASASGDQTVRTWSSDTGDLQWTFEGHTAYVSSVVFSPDSKLVASASWDRTIRIWSSETGDLKRTLEGHIGSVSSVAFSPDSKLVASASWDQTVRIWSTDTGDLQRPFKGHTASVTSVVFSPDSKRVASASRDQTVRIWSSETGDLQWTLEGHTAYVTSVAFSPDSKLVASASWDRTVRIWSSETGDLKRTLEGHIGSVSSVAFSPDSKLVASASWDQTVRIWSSETGGLQQTLEDHIGSVSSVVFSPDSKLVASASWDRTVQLWSSDTGDPKRTLEGHTAYVTSVAFSPDSNFVASTSTDHTVRIWSSETGDLQRIVNIGYLSQALSFYQEGPLYYLCTDAGAISLDTSLVPINSANAVIDKPSSASSVLSLANYNPGDLFGYGISKDRSWITLHGSNLLWLPADARPSSCAVSGSIIVIGCGSGRLIIMRLAMKGILST